MQKSKYNLISDSTEYTDDYGDAYPDIYTYPINNFSTTSKSMLYRLEQADIERFDVLMYNYYDSSDYDTYVLWLNGIEHIADEEEGTEIYLPSKTDLDAFILDNQV